MKHFLLPIVFLFTNLATSQDIKSPSEFLGYELGSQFTRHHEVVDYYEYLAKKAPERVQLVEYGKTNERRPLLLAYVSSATNMKNLETIREEHLKSTTGESNASKAIVWLSYNVHGNESVSTEASMKTIYELLTNKSNYLENTVVIIDPCINPDGRDRYVNWYNQYKNTPNNVDPYSKEHVEGWWNGRSNHYMFDLNRDWAWLTQVESQQRLIMYNKWLPHVHVDFHEQGVNSPYYFAPAAEPFHEVITDFQRDFQVTIGKNHAKYFDANGWFYFTKEVFDLFYPSYGDTYPTYNGAIGMTYEQAGIGAGLGIKTNIGDTLTLKDRIAHHYTTGMSTVEVSANNVDKLNKEFQKFYENKNYKYKNYVLGGNMDKINSLTQLLDKHKIEYGWSSTTQTIKGFNYKKGETGSLKTFPGSLVVSANQPKSTLVKVLFEPDAKLSDSLTYDITAWSLPYAYGLDAVASESTIPTQNGDVQHDYAGAPTLGEINEDNYAYIMPWHTMKDAAFLADLLQKNIRVRFAQKPFSLDGRQYKHGTLIITKSDNKNHKDFIGTLKKLKEKHGRSLNATKTGFVDSGKDFGSSYVQMVPNIKVAMLSGGPTSTLRFGEIWHFFEQQLHYPLSVLDADYIKRVDLDTYDVLILPGGRYTSFMDENTLKKLKDWVSNGGKLIAIGGSISGISGEKGFSIKKKKEDKEKDSTLYSHENIQRERIKDAITGAIFKTKVDNTHPMAYGYGNSYYTLKLGNTAYDFLKAGTVAHIEENTIPVSGFAGSKAQKKIENTLVFGVENHGRGHVVYMVDNPLFRGFWENGKLFFANALFMVN
ncbi:hypothetical protein GGR42_000993 [Saonia flava]|uniref:Peptidase M14 domain-containing protein n=1 Tax=Saonia flava TaxID=523696 RepID=A0A846QQV8_9FLAO|nr:M14 family metallopeptidase [Saonia flava]NJB70531.1 hypothetical protein [Saonia flava]